MADNSDNNSNNVVEQTPQPGENGVPSNTPQPPESPASTLLNSENEVARHPSGSTPSSSSSTQVNSENKVEIAQHPPVSPSSPPSSPSTPSNSENEVAQQHPPAESTPSPPSTPLNSENEVEVAQHSPESTPTLPSSSPSTPPAVEPEDRTALIYRARAFLASPEVIHEDPTTKRRFLSEKGLRVDEIDGLLRELPPQLPPVPPRTYPQPPPSKLPYLLLGLTRIFTWITGSSAVLIFIYYKFLLPRITRSALARRALKQHQVALLKRLNTSLTDLKIIQAETRSVLPSVPTPHEPAEFTDIHTLDELRLDGDAPITVPAFTLLRCTIEGLMKDSKKPTREELFALLEERFMWLRTVEGLAYQDSLWETLTTNPAFSTSNETNRLVWTYTPPPPIQPQPAPLQTSLTTLLSSFPPPHSRHTHTTERTPTQRTLEALADFTGYITTQTYQFSSGLMRHGFSSSFSSSSPLSPQQEDVKKEIRALKGLVLNRRTFAPTAVRSPSQEFAGQSN